MDSVINFELLDVGDIEAITRKELADIAGREGQQLIDLDRYRNSAS